MNLKNNEIKVFFALILSISILVTSISDIALVWGNDVATVENTVEAPVDSAISLSAALYSDSGRTEERIALSSEGATCEGWQYDTDLYLGITVSGLPMTGEDQYQLVIEMEPIMYLNQNSAPELANTTVSFEQNKFTVNEDYDYPVKTYSLSNLTYLIDNGIDGLTFGLPVRYDTNLWDKLDGANLGDGTTPLLRVYVQKVGSDTPVEACDLKLMQVTTSGEIAIDSNVKVVMPTNTSTGSNTMGIDESRKLIVSRSHDISFKGGYYYKDLEIIITLPTCTVSGTTYTLEYSEINFPTAGGSSPYETNVSDGVLTFNAENFYYNNGALMNMILEAPDSIKLINGTHLFSGKVTAFADGKALYKDFPISITVDNNTAPILKSTCASGSANVLDIDTVQCLGGLAISNQAAFDNGSGRLDVALDFDTNNTSAIGVTSINMMCDRDTEYIDISYTLVDKDGNPYTKDGQSVFTDQVKNKHYNPSSTSTNNKYQLYNRNNLPEEQRDYYFKSFTYSIGNLDGNTYAYHTGANKAPYSGGTIWGYVLTNELPDVNPKHKMTLYFGKAEDGNVALTASTTVIIDAGTTVAYGLDTAYLSDSEIDAGNPFTIKGNVFVPSYPYTSNNCLNNIRLGLLLPEGVSINESSIDAYYTNKNKLQVSQVTKREVDTGKYFWTIVFEEGQKIGYYNESLNAIANGGSLAFSMQLNTDREMPTQTIVLRETVFVAGNKIKNGAGGSYASNAYKDNYDLNNNGSYEDNVGCFKDSGLSITINASPAELDITDTLRKADGTSGSALTLNSFADSVNYDLKISCTKGGSAEHFQYYVPIARATNENEANFVVSNGVTSEIATSATDTNELKVELKMTGPATVTTVGGTKLKVQYTTDTLANYSAASSSTTNWVDTVADDQWQNVTMLKIISTEDTISNGTDNTVSVPLAYLGAPLDYETYAGVKVVWKSRGYYDYTLGSNSSSGTQSTEGCALTLAYTPEKPEEFTLTAAKDRNLENTDAVNRYSFSLPEFVLAQEYSITEIKATNVTLVDSTYNFENADSVKSNTDFRITISVDDDEVYEEDNDTSLPQGPVDIKENDTIVGSLEGNTAPTFTFELFNADALSDIVTERYVEFTLVGSNGVIVPVKINIARLMASAEPTSSAIVAGKRYVPFNDITTEIDVSQDSAFTAQFVTSGFIPQNYEVAELVFSSKPVVGTTIAMIDWTDDDNLKFYHYEITETSSTSIPLTNFIEMGSNNQYQKSESNDFVKETLLFIVEYPLSGEHIFDEASTVKLSRKLNSNSSTDVSTELKFQTVTKRSFGLKVKNLSDVEENEFNRGEDFKLSYSSVCSITDSRYTNRNLSLVIEADGNKLPNDSTLTVGDKVYYLNSQAKFIIPLDAVQMGNGERTITYSSASSGDIKLKATLYASATAEGLKPMLGELVAEPVTVTLKDISIPSFKVLSMSKRLLHTADLIDLITVNYEYLNADSITVEVQKKEGSGYVTQSSILEAVNGVTTHSQGVFFILNESTAVGGDSSATLKLSANSPTGTYRVLFTISKDENSIEVPYNFIVIE